MNNLLTLAFDRPGYLALLGLLPVVWWIGCRSLAGFSRWSRFWALALRFSVVTLLVLALAEVQLVRVSERIAAYFLLDQSLSLTPEQRQASLQYAAGAIAQHRDSAKGDLSGVIVFGGEAIVEQPLSEAAAPPFRVEAAINGEHTNLASALKLAKASLPEGAARRVIVLSDGNENLGDALVEARGLAEAGIGIDVAPLPHLAAADVRVERITVPNIARASVPYDVAIVLEHSPPPHAEAAKPVSGRLVVTRKAGTTSELVADQTVDVPVGKKVYRFREELKEPAFYSYEARFIPADGAADRVSQNNQATGHTHLEGRGQVLFIVNSESPLEFDPLIAQLRAAEMHVTVQQTDALFSSLAELQQYDSVILADVPRVSGESADKLNNFTDDQVRMLVQNVEQLGAGLIMLGGPNSFGAGGWANSELERAMPVDFQIRNAKVAAVGALMLVIDHSGSMEGEKLRLSKAAAQSSVEMLGPLDQIGVITFDSGFDEVVRLQRVGERPHRIKSQIGQIAGGGGTNMEPGMSRGYAVLERATASVKHMIVLTDGQTEGSGYERLAREMRKKGITTTAVAIGTDASKNLLQGIATSGGGKYYQVNNPRALPRIFTRETRRVVRPLIFEEAAGFRPQIVAHHEVLAGVEGPLPSITGFVLTTLKESPLVEAPILSPRPGAKNNTVLATWNFGLGRTAAFTTDAGQRWAKPWESWEGQEKLFVQLVRWSMRPLGDQGSFTLATEIRDGVLRTVVTGVDKDGKFLNELPIKGALADAAGKSQGSLHFQQVAPGRYVAETPLGDVGSYLLAVFPGPGQAPLRSGVNLPYSKEFNEQAPNESLLAELANMTPQGGSRGEILRLPESPQDWRRWQGPNVFRRDLAQGRSLTAVWPIVVLLGAGCFLLDVAHRRVGVAPWFGSAGAFGYGRSLLKRLGGRSADAGAPTAQIARLKSVRAEVRSRSQSESRFVVENETTTTTLQPASTAEFAVHPPNALASQPTSAKSPKPVESRAEEMTYSERLLEVKRGLRKPESE